MHPLKSARNAVKSNRTDSHAFYRSKQNGIVVALWEFQEQARLIQINVDEGTLISRNCAFFMGKAAIYIKINIMMPSKVRTRHDATAASWVQNRHHECKLNVPMEWHLLLHLLFISVLLSFCFSRSLFCSTDLSFIAYHFMCNTFSLFLCILHSILYSKQEYEYHSAFFFHLQSLQKLKYIASFVQISRMKMLNWKKFFLQQHEIH